MILLLDDNFLLQAAFYTLGVVCATLLLVKFANRYKDK